MDSVRVVVPAHSSEPTLTHRGGRVPAQAGAAVEVLTAGDGSAEATLGRAGACRVPRTFVPASSRDL